MARSNEGLAVGQLRRQVRLESEAVYRVCELDDDFAAVEVVRAPGLHPGQRFRFKRDAVAAMELAEPAAGG